MADEDGDADSEVEEYSGMEQPPLIKQLKSILAEYPDDGQIIKVGLSNETLYTYAHQLTIQS